MDGSSDLLPEVSDQPDIELQEDIATANSVREIHLRWSATSIDGDTDDNRHPQIRQRGTSVALNGRWNFYDSRMASIRRLLQLTFLSDPFSTSQAALNRKLGLNRYFYACSDNPQTCIGFGTLFRWFSNLLCACAAFAMWGIMFTGDNIPTIKQGEGAGSRDLTQLPVKIATVLFHVELMATMILFPSAARSFSSRHIQRGTVQQMSNAILWTGSFMFWLTYLIVFFSVIFLGEMKKESSQNFSNQMFNMHKIWIGPDLIKHPAFLVFYCSGMFVGFAIYIVSVSHSCLLCRCVIFTVLHFTSHFALRLLNALAFTRA